MSCGQSLAPAGDEAMAAALQARLAAAAPTPLVEKMRAAKLTGERKVVTALFADVVGSTTLAESMDAEDWTQIINEAFDLMGKAIFHYEGTIAQLQGDALLAFFGAPVAHEDDPERAVRAALDMVESINEYAAQLKRTHGIDFRIRAGINTGPVIVGNVGSDLRYEYTALGDAVNVAARVQTAAQPGDVLISAMTQRHVMTTFDFEDLGGVQVKGKSEPVHLYKVVGLQAQPGRKRGLEAVGLSSPLVGRNAELKTLTDLFAVARAGRGRLAVILGEPGLGKSRLLAELKAAIGAQPAAVDAAPGSIEWVEGRCVTYGRALPYHLVFDLVWSLLGIRSADVESVPRREVDDRLTALLGDEAKDVAPYLAHMLGMALTPADLDRVQLDPSALQGRYVSAIARVVHALADKGPLVLVTEDIHWADPASVEILVQLVPLLTPLPVLALFVGRVETDAPGWRLVTQIKAGLGDAVTEIRLQPLDDSSSRQLVSNLLEIESL
ncbi:MAG: adenylate/guanylate cyclase domain-containing protein, partial [Chloroflexota bacterium]|nr:adenylate/guanylate cyclase domain-containing protein [Chloroflexota bacterium]